jgi:hypothetical protein
VSFVQEFAAFFFKRPPFERHSDLPINSMALVLDGQSGRKFKKPLSKGREEIVDVAARSIG